LQFAEWERYHQLRSLRAYEIGGELAGAVSDEGLVTASSSQMGTASAVFDVLGRSYYVGMRVRM
jgi:hypothetical protein